jgi:hypothetical protein
VRGWKGAFWRSAGRIALTGAAALALAAQVSDAAHAEEAARPPELGLPLACEPHKTCFIQNYVDDGAAAEGNSTDYACGSATYPKHSGTDFRLLSNKVSKDGVAVLATAPGKVKARRDGVADLLLREAKRLGTAEVIKGRECGNGVVIDHGGGWETQYCHMKQGSVVVHEGQDVQRGDKLGEVGFSGQADFAHVHLSVRHDGKPVDPFLPDPLPQASCSKDASGKGLWIDTAAQAFPYRVGEIIGTGFAGAPPARDQLEIDHTSIAPPEPQSPALVYYARIINMAAGDKLHIVLSGPEGISAEETSPPLAHSMAVSVPYIGKKRTSPAWPPGLYNGRAEIIRQDAVLTAAEDSFELRAPAEP